MLKNVRRLWLSGVVAALTAIFVFQSNAAPFMPPASFTRHATKQTSTTGTPDFAYPKKVEANSREALRKALNRGDDRAALRAVIDCSLAITAIDPDSLTSAIRLIDSASASFSSPADRALASLLKATVYSQVYNSRRYFYDKREIDSSSDTIILWSGKQFRSAIIALCDSAVAAEKSLAAIPLSDYHTIVEMPAESRIFFPTLFDFVAYKSIELIVKSSEDNIYKYRHNLPTSLKAIFDAVDRIHANDYGPLIYFRTLLTTLSVFNNYSSRYDNALTESYTKLFNEFFSKSEFAAYPLELIYSKSNIALDSETQDELKKYCADIERTLKKYPAVFNHTSLKKILNALKAPKVKLETRNVTSPGVRIPISVTSNNCQRIKVRIYDISRLTNLRDEKLYNTLISSRQPKKEITLTFEGTAPFVAKADTFMTIDNYGIYAIVPVVDNIKGLVPADSHAEVRCTSMSLSGITSSCSNLMYVCDPATGRPTADATINRKNDRGTTTLAGTTDSDGLLGIPTDDSGIFSASKGADRYAPTKYIYNRQYNKYDSDNYYHSLAFDRPIYHPGDTVGFVLICAEDKNGRFETAPDRKLIAVMHDCNNNAVDTMTATTDRFGRIAGRMAIPEDGLTGRFSIKVSDGINPGIRRTFMVSDYKLPDFKITFSNPKTNAPSEGCATVSGTVVTYSGFPLSDTKILIDVKACSLGFPWSRTSSTNLGTTTATTDSSGCFTAVLESALLSIAGPEYPVFEINATATSPSGETQQATTSFMLAPCYQIRINLPESGNIDLTDGDAPIGIDVFDSENHSTTRQVKVVLRNSQGDSLRCDTLSTPVKSLPWGTVPSGTYAMEAKPIGFDANSIERDLVLYRSTDTVSPVEYPLWTPSVKAGFDGNEAEILYAAAQDSTYILAIVSSSDTILSRSTFMTSAGFHRFKTKIPASVNNARVTLFTIKNFESELTYVDLTRTASVRKLKFVRESFRDHLRPATGETWRFRAIVNDSASVEAAVVLGMYNKALDALEKYNSPNIPYSPMRSNPSFDCFYTYRTTATLLKRIKLNFSSIKPPFWNFYGRQFNLSGFRVINQMKMNSAPTAAIMEDAQFEDLCANDEDYAVVGYGVIARTRSGAGEHEESRLSDGGQSGDEAPEESQFDFRESETPLAFFCPMLTTAPDGTLEFSFEVPNATATWNFNALAFTRDMLSATSTAEVISSKPVMVSPNLPRFVRLGDSIDISATVMNNTDSTQHVTTVVEIFNPTDGKIIDTHRFEAEIAPMKSADATISVLASAGPFFGYRIKSSTSEFADGEQSIIQVLPASQPVVESTTFYLAPDSTQLSVKLGNMPDDADVTLSYCDNPLWYVVTALPGLSDNAFSTPGAASQAIFASAIASGILRDNPEVAEALRKWSDEKGDDSMLQSMLEKNASLKIMLLNATPWMMDASNDSERMSRLALLFDKSQVDATINSAIASLDKLQNPDGGFRWMGQCTESSLWATECAISLMGHLQCLGMMPADKKLDRIIRKAVEYVDKETADNYRRYPNSNYLDYAFNRLRLKNIQIPTANQRVIAAASERAVGNWRDYSLFDKAIAAMLLANEGHRSTAAEIMKSCDEFAVTSPEKGMWWPSLNSTWEGSMNNLGITAALLEAYHTVNPSASQIDPIRQWLILQKEARDWGNAPSVSTVVADILLTSGRWISKGSEADIRIGGKRVKAPKGEEFTGSWQTEVADLDPSGKTLTVKRTSSTPAWGSVVSRYIAPMSEIAPCAGSSIAISKKLYRQNTGNGEWEECREFKIGDRVRVELTVSCDRQLDYVAIVDNRAACFEPVEQTPKPIFSEGICFYRENRDDATNIFITRLPKGSYRLTYDLWANNAGDFASGLASAQSQYAPQHTAHSGGAMLKVTQ